MERAREAASLDRAKRRRDRDADGTRTVGTVLASAMSCPVSYGRGRAGPRCARSRRDPRAHPAPCRTAPACSRHDGSRHTPAPAAQSLDPRQDGVGGRRPGPSAAARDDSETIVHKCPSPAWCRPGSSDISLDQAS